MHLLEMDVSMFDFTFASQKINTVVLGNSVKVIWSNQTCFTAFFPLASSPVQNTVNSSFPGTFRRFHYHSYNAISGKIL